MALLEADNLRIPRGYRVFKAPHKWFYSRNSPKGPLCGESRKYWSADAYLYRVLNSIAAHEANHDIGGWDSPPTPDGMAIASPWAKFIHLANLLPRRGHSQYPYYWADMGFLSNPDPSFQEMMGENTIYIGLCDGDSAKTTEYARKRRLAYIIINDLIPGNVTEGKTNLGAINNEKGGREYSDDQIIGLPGDITKQEFWDCLERIILNLKRKNPRLRAVILIQGATWNIFDKEKREKILGFMQEKRHAFYKARIYVDNMLIQSCLKAFYYHKSFLDLAFISLALHPEKLGDYTPKSISRHVFIYGNGEEKQIRFAVQNEKERRFHLFDSINKISEETTLAEFERFSLNPKRIALNENDLKFPPLTSGASDRAICESLIRPVLGHYNPYDLNLSPHPA